MKQVKLFKTSLDNIPIIGLEVKKKAPPPCGLFCEADSNGGSSANLWSLTKRTELLSKNALNKKLLSIMLKKNTNLCLAADFTTTEDILTVCSFDSVLLNDILRKKSFIKFNSEIL